MNMSEIENIEARVPIGMQLELNQLVRDRLVANAKRDRSNYMAATFSRMVAVLKMFASQARSDAGYPTGEHLPQ